MTEAQRVRHRAQHREWLRANADRVKQYQRVYRAEHQEELREYTRLKRLADPEKTRERDQARYERTREHQLEYHRLRRQADPEKAHARDKAQHARHHEKELAQHREWLRRNADHMKLYRKEYEAEHRESVTQRALGRWRAHPERQRTYRQNRLVNDAGFRFQYRLRASIIRRLHGTRKTGKTVELIGCTIGQLRAHLEAQFLPGMTWENLSFRGWHIDHIRPCSSFDLTDPEQQRQCFHWTNLQPLWAEENMRKGNRYAA